MSEHKVRYYRDLRDIPWLSPREKDELYPVSCKYAFRANSYYLSLINWDDPQDPIRRLIIPHPDELADWGRLDPSNEHTFTVMPGLEHKYHSTALLLVSSVCEGICRYCFRKRVFISPKQELLRDLDGMIGYLQSHTEITNVLITGGDPLTLSTRKLKKIIAALRQVEHIKIIRIGTRIPVFNPYRILDDPALLAMIEKHSFPDRKIYIMTHFCHSNELTEPALQAAHILQRAGAVLCNQCPLIRGVNDDPQSLAELMRRLSFAGIVPYYLFQCRPAVGNHGYTVPIEEGYEIAEQTRAMVSGLAKRFRFVMSHSTGKVEILARMEDQIIFKYHRAADDSDSGRVLVCKSNPLACWLDDYEEVIREYSHEQPYRLYGPE